MLKTSEFYIYRKTNGISREHKHILNQSELHRMGIIKKTAIEAKEYSTEKLPFNITI